MNPIRVIAIAVVLATTGLPAPGARGDPRDTRSPEARTPGGDWRNPSSWRRLRLGMSQAQVIRILGEPGRITRYYAFTRWEYPDALGLRVNFDEHGRLLAWGALAR